MEDAGVLADESSTVETNFRRNDGHQSLLIGVWEESKELWRIVGPTIFSLLSSFTMLVIAQASSGHLGDLELAAMSLACNIIVGWDFGLMLGMASALETLCGQAFGAKNYPVLGIYLQRSWIIMLGSCLLTLPVYIFATPILKTLGQSPEVAERAGYVALYCIPLHFSFAFQFPLQRFLQSQLHNSVIGWVNFVALIVHLFLSWLLVFKLRLGLAAISLALSFCWWVVVIGLFGYTLSGKCAQSWTGFSSEAFSGLWPFLKLCISSGVMMCLESWYFQILVVIAGHVSDSATVFDALSVCLSINEWEYMIHIGFLIALGVRVANELGEGNGGKAKFATIVAVTQSVILGLIFCVLIICLHNKFALIYTTSEPVLKEVSKLSVLLAFTVLLNSVQPILSGVAVGSGWQAYVAYINLGCYYFIGVPLGVLLGWVFKKGITGVWAGMIFGGTAIQTIILATAVIRCDWDKEASKAGMHVEMWAHITDQEGSQRTA